MNRKLFFISAVAALSVAMTGCGIKVYDLTEDEENQIVSYAAAAVAKHNSNQTMGLVKNPSDDSAKDKDSSPMKDNPEDTDQKNTANGQNEDADGSAENGGSQGGSSSAAGGNAADTPAGSAVSLTDAIGISGITFQYTGASIQNNYKAGDYMILMPDDGNKYLVLSFRATNSAQSPVLIDLLSRKASYTLTVDGQNSADNAETILLNDMSTYQATLEAGGSADLVLLFEFPENQISDSSALTLVMHDGGTDKNIQL